MRKYCTHSASIHKIYVDLPVADQFKYLENIVDEDTDMFGKIREEW